MAFLNTRDSADLDESVETAVEGEIREFVRRDVATSLRRQPESDSEMVANNITSLLQRVAGTSVQEIDKLISNCRRSATCCRMKARACSARSSSTPP